MRKGRSFPRAVVAAAAGAALLGQSFPAQLGLTEADARRQLLAVIDAGGPEQRHPIPEAARKKFLALAPPAKRVVAAGVWAWARGYVGSSAFKSEYARIRAAHSPQATRYDSSIEEELRQRAEKQKADLAGGLEALPMLPPADRPTVEAEIRKSQAYFDSREYLDVERAKIEQERGGDRADLKTQVERWNDLYPADPDALVARTLREFLEATADVDWNARLIQYGDRKVFGSSEYLDKPWQWQEAFWAGRETTDLAREAAETWLRDLGAEVPPAPKTVVSVLSNARVPVNLSGAGGVARIVIGENHAMFLDPDGTLRTWTSNPVSANQVGDFGLGHFNKVPIDAPIPVPGLAGVFKASAGSACSFAVLADGTLLAWGSRRSGQLGTTRREEIGVDLLPPGGDVSSPTRLSVPFAAADVSAGYDHVLALARDGTVYAWGDGSYGRLGIGELPVIQVRTNAPRTLRDVLYPVPVAGLSGVIAVSTGREHSLALLADGTVRAWGRNKHGEVGDGTTEDRATPVPVRGVRNAVAVGAGSSLSAALLADGTVMTWGGNESRQLGRPGPAANPVPAPVPGARDIRAIAVGDRHVLALTGAGTVVSWGDDQFGATGRNKSASDVPKAIPGLTGVQAVYAKFNRSFAVLADGSVRVWGVVPLFARPVGDTFLSPIPIDLLLHPKAPAP